MDAGSGTGRFVVLDGPDGCGKSTQARSLVEWLRLRGRTVRHLRDPGGTRIGERIRSILLDPVHREICPRAEALLFMASRAQLAAEEILPALRAGEVVVCERWVSATMAYQGAGGGLGAEALLAAGSIATGDLVPDLTLILDVDPAEGLARIGRSPDLMEARPVAFHERVRGEFLAIAAAGTLNARLIPAGPAGAVEAAVREAVRHVL